MNEIKPTRPMRLLVACDAVVLRGGIMRFDRIAAAIRKWGHELSFVRLAEQASPGFITDTPVLTLEQSKSQHWDAVMVPGAGFPETMFESFAAFRQKRFGIRAQFILNDQSRRKRFKAVNEAFDPHLILFNNEHWPVGSYTEFSADRFHTLLGAVDTLAFRPNIRRTYPLSPKRWIIGGIANKNPDALIDALNMLSDDIRVRLFGIDSYGVKSRYANLIKEGRLRLAGPLFGSELAGFYQGVDCVVMTELTAGWANIAAEALASGVPLICTPHGTTAFARHEKTALLVSNPTPVALAEAVRRLRRDPVLCRQLSENGRRAIESFDWNAYSHRLLTLLKHDRCRHYFHAPDAGLFGKWPLSERLEGLERLLNKSRHMSLIDFGAAEGLVGRQFLQHGVRLLHGFEVDTNRVDIANAICADWPQASFHVADLSDWNQFHKSNRHLLLSEGYDIVLYLGLHHHLPIQSRYRVLEKAIRMARCYFAFRSPAAVYRSDGIEELLTQAGFVQLASGNRNNKGEHLGECHIYERFSASRSN